MPKEASGGRKSASGNVNSGMRPVASQPAMPSHGTTASVSGFSKATAGAGMVEQRPSGKPADPKASP